MTELNINPNKYLMGIFKTKKEPVDDPSINTMLYNSKLQLNQPYMGQMNLSGMSLMFPTKISVDDFNDLEAIKKNLNITNANITNARFLPGNKITGSYSYISDIGQNFGVNYTAVGQSPLNVLGLSYLLPAETKYSFNYQWDNPLFQDKYSIGADFSLTPALGVNLHFPVDAALTSIGKANTTPIIDLINNTKTYYTGTSTAINIGAGIDWTIYNAFDVDTLKIILGYNLPIASYDNAQNNNQWTFLRNTPLSLLNISFGVGWGPLTAMIIKNLSIEPAFSLSATFPELSFSVLGAKIMNHDYLKPEIYYNLNKNEFGGSIETSFFDSQLKIKGNANYNFQSQKANYGISVEASLFEWY